MRAFDLSDLPVGKWACTFAVLNNEPGPEPIAHRFVRGVERLSFTITVEELRGMDGNRY
ncbi:hypothetical protein DM2_2206 [Halorubrum sp. DM2]|nr:hypothetical protein DM2_2206 [Halorubrum sp. DM2]